MRVIEYTTHEAGTLPWNSRVQGKMIEYGWRGVRGVLCSGLRIRPNHPGGIANI